MADKLEARVTPIDIPMQDVRRCIDGNSIRDDIDEKNLTYVIHFIKQSEHFVHKKFYGSRYDYAQKYREQIDKILEDARKRHDAISNLQPIYKIVGIDAAGAEIDCSPAVFGQTYRYARLRGITNLTYHVGEDFYDLCDGLKAIDDAIRFLHLGKGCRLGHAIALGISPKEYYERRGYETIMTRQRLLDTLVWVYGTMRLQKMVISGSCAKNLEDKMSKLYDKIGYSIPFDIDTYHLSMMLRSDSLDSSSQYSCWRRASQCQDQLCRKAQKNQSAIDLCNDFLTNKKIWDNGNIVETYTYHPEIVEIASILQDYLQCVVLDKGLIIETNPSSNVVIGPIDGYESLPIHSFVRNGIIVSVNTDDKGIFSTSLINEYSLYASSSRKIGTSFSDVVKHIKDIRINAENSRFHPQKPTL